MLSATFKLSMFEPNSRAMLYKTPNRWDWEVKDNPPRTTTEIAQTYIRSAINDQASRPWLFALLAGSSILLLFRSGAVSMEEGQLALALLSSGMVYLLTYFFFNVSAEYRYFYWVGFASYLGFMITVLLRVSAAHRTTPANENTSKTHRAIRLSALSLGALGVALAVFPFRLPMDNRTITINPVDGRPVVVISVRNVATPKWMSEPFQGKIEPAAWSRDHLWQGFNQARAPVVVELETLRENIEIVLKTGPEMGLANIETQGLQQIVNAQNAQAGTTSVTIGPLSSAGGAHEKSTSLNLPAALLSLMAIFVLMLKLSEPLAAKPGCSG